MLHLGKAETKGDQEMGFDHPFLQSRPLFWILEASSRAKYLLRKEVNTYALCDAC